MAVPTHVRRLLGELPDSSLVLDVGGWAQPDPRADWVIDIGPYETRNWYRTIGAEIPDVPERFTRGTWVERDICAVEPWPFEDDMFDFVICSQTLEDLRDPVRVCVEMARVGKAGYIETPSAATELTRGIESPLWCGWRHHRWLVERDDDGLVFLAKPHHIHSHLWPSIRSPRVLHPDARNSLEFAWTGSFRAREEILVAADDLEGRLQDIVRRSALPDALGSVRRRTLEPAWRGYRAARGLAGRLVRR